MKKQIYIYWRNNMHSMFTRTIKFLIQRPLVTNLILIFILLSSIIAIFSIQRSNFPRIDLYEISVHTKYPGASPKDVELNVTKKIEEAIEGVSDIVQYTSQSMENLSLVFIQIDANCEDIKKIKNDIKDAIDDITDFPKEVTEKPEIFEDKTDNMPILEIGIFTTDPAKNNYIDIARNLRKELITLPGIADVNHGGASKSEYQILLDIKKLQHSLISIDEVIEAIKLNKIRLSAGSFESFTTETSIVTLSEFSTPEQIGEIIIRANDFGKTIKLREIAKIIKTHEKEHKLLRINGHNGTWLSVTKLGTKDILTSVKEVRSTIEQFRKVFPVPSNIKIITLADESVNTENRLFILYSNAIAGLVLVLVLLFLFFNKRIAFWAAAGIPIAIGIAFIAVSFMDVTINQISLLGLIVVLGMLVDDSIIIAENIYRYKKKYSSAEEAVIKGLMNVVRPVTVCILTTVIVFIPFYFMPGDVMDFTRELPTFVIAVLIGSLIESCVILPVHLAHDKDDTGTIPRGEPFLNYLEQKYSLLLTKILKHRYKSCLLITVSFIAAVTLSVLLVKFKMFPIDQATSLNITGETKQNSNLAYTSQVVRSVEKIINTLPENTLKSYRTIIGEKGFDDESYLTISNGFILEIVLHPASERDMSAEDVKNYIFDTIKKENITGIEQIDYHIDSGGPPAEKPVEIDIIGNDTAQRKRLITKVKNDLIKMGLPNVDDNFREGKKEIQLIPHYHNISQGELSVSQIASIIRTAFDGEIVTDHNTADENIEFRVMLDPDQVNSKKPLKGLYTMNKRGIPIAIERFLHKKNVKSTQTIYRFNGTRTNKITSNLPEDMGEAEVFDILEEKYKNFAKENPGFKINLGGEAEESADTLIKMIFAVCLAIIAVYFVLVIQFNSLIQPLMVISAIPFGLLGILLAFGLQGFNLSMLAMIGIIGYSGVVVNDSLIMVDFINQSRNKPGVFTQTVINGAALRFRPIFLTTVTTVAGLVPTAYGFIGGIDTFISPMVMAIAWGLIVGTPSVLIIIPLFYVIIEDLRNIFRKQKTGSQ